MGPDGLPVGSISHDKVRMEARLSREYLEGDCGWPDEMKFSVCICVPRGVKVGEPGSESGKLDADRDMAAGRSGWSGWSVSDISEKSGELLYSSMGVGGPQIGTVFVVRRTGHESLARLDLE